MNKAETVIWILAYTGTITNLLSGLIYHSRNKERQTASFLFLLINIFLITLISIASSIELLSDRIFGILLFGLLLALYWTIPRLIFSMEKLPFPEKKYIAAVLPLFCVGVALHLLKIEIFPIIYTIWWIPHLLIVFHVNKLTKRLDREAEKIRIMDFAVNLKAAWYLTGIITIFMGLTVLSIFFSPFRSKGLYSSIFGFFYCLYNLPSLSFFLNSLIKSSTYKVPEQRSPLNELLSPRELEVAELLILGKKYKEIGEEMCVSLSTVKKHTNNIYRKTGVGNGRQLIQFAIHKDNQ